MFVVTIPNISLYFRLLRTAFCGIYSSFSVIWLLLVHYS